MNSAPNFTLKAALVRRGVHLYQSFLEIGIGQIRGSKIVSGIAEPTEDEKQKICALLDSTEEELFPNPDTEPVGA